MKSAQWRNWWWVFAIAALVSFFYVPAMRGKKMTLNELAFRLQEMEKEKCCAMQEKEELALQIHSQNDPAWIEMVLMRDLGVVPEGWLKVHFKK